jgi:hypothetical protein
MLQHPTSLVRSLSPALLAALCPALAPAQESLGATRRPAPVVPPEAAHIAMGAPRDLGPGNDDDELPLPNPPRYRVIDGVDMLVEPASGDPHFLGFAAGRYTPPADERFDPELLALLRSSYADGRPRQETYAFVMFDKRITEARLDLLRAAGARVIGIHPHATVKVALAPATVAVVGTLEFVRWIGVPRSWQKLHPRLSERLARDERETIDLYVNVHDSDLGADSVAEILARPEIGGPAGDVAFQPLGHAAVRWLSNGWQQRALEALGASVIEYEDGIRAFRVRADAAAIERIVAQDFVQFVELDVAKAALHDESAPLIMTDATRVSYDGDRTLSVVGAIVDSGVTVQHQALNPTHVGWDLSSGTSATLDNCGHGTHVAGTILADGTNAASLRGQVPELGWGTLGCFYNVKIFNSTCQGSVSLSSIFNLTHTPYDDGTNTSAAPQVVNHSWGSIQTGGWFGTEADARSIDSEVNGYGQLHCFAAGNAGPNAGSLTLHASAKNALTVGSCRDFPQGGLEPGDMSSFSSRGPVADGRWKPNLHAPGEAIKSTSNDLGYEEMSGTSMATPHVSGLALQVLDHHTWLQGWPEALAAHLMASAMTPANSVITYPSDANLDVFGTGRVQAERAHNPSANLAFWVWF